MSQWDFGHGREPTEHHEPQYPQQPPYPYPEQQEPEYPQYAYPQEPQHPQYAYPQEPQYQYPQPPQYPDAQYPDAQYPDAQQPPYPPHPYPQQPEGPGGPAYLPDQAGWSGDASWPGDAGWPGDVAQPEQAGWPNADGYPGDGEAYDPPTAYPITYERDEFEGRASGPVEAPTRSFWPQAPDPADRFGSDPSGQRQQWRPADREPWRPGGDAGPPFGPPPPPHAGPWSRGGPPPSQGGAPWPQDAEEEWDDAEAPDDRWRWLIPASLAVAGAAVGAAIVVFALGHGKAAAGTPPPTAPPSSATGAAHAAGGAATTPLTLAAARSALAGYTSANNSANTRRSAGTLAGVETGGSYAIDAGLYTVQAADGAAPYAAFTPVAATYYIPRAEPADGPRWFAVQVSNAFTADPGKVTSTEYLLFTQAASGAWQNAVEPYLLAGADAPQIAVGGDGLATAVSPTATSLAVAPGKLAERTAAAIDGTGAGVTVADPGALADRSDQTFWRGKLPTATVTDAHTAATGAAGQTFALLTTTGGALVFYTDAAEVAITPPAGSAIHLTVPGYYSPAQALSRAGLGYLDQFAAADPPAGAGTPRIIAEYSGITGKN
jgi:hypothetical protein